MVSIDMPAGPSEVLVIADKYASPVHIAADLLSQVLTCSAILSLRDCFIGWISYKRVFIYWL